LPGGLASVDVRVMGLPVARGSRREIVELESGASVLVVIVDREDSEAGGVGRVLEGGLVVAVVSEPKPVIFPGNSSKCVPLTLICTNGALASAVVIRSTCANVSVTFLPSITLPIPAISTISTLLAVSGSGAGASSKTIPETPTTRPSPFSSISGLGCGLLRNASRPGASIGEK
jgi:hypothetical protein